MLALCISGDNNYVAVMLFPSLAVLSTRVQDITQPSCKYQTKIVPTMAVFVAQYKVLTNDS